MLNDYKNYVAGFERLVREGGKLAPGTVGRVARAKFPAGKSTVLIFSPHPDDECITGGLALRLLREAGMRVVNVAVTLGSNKARRAAREAELKKACGYLGFDLVVAAPGGLQHVDAETRASRRGHWAGAVKVIARILREQSPKAIFVPHEHDWHRTHVGTHHLVMDALRAMPAGFACHVIETEFWGQMARPNLMVEVGVNDLGDLVTALALHAGEVKRNAYHLRLPAWMMDNVRRAERVGGPGSPAPAFTFATNYRVRKWRGGRLREARNGGKFLPEKMTPASVFEE